MVWTLDELARVHVGWQRTDPPGLGAYPQRDSLLRAHVGWYAFRDGTEEVIDGVFCVVVEDDVDVELALKTDEALCVVALESAAVEIGAAFDGVLCIAASVADRGTRLNRNWRPTS